MALSITLPYCSWPMLHYADRLLNCLIQTPLSRPSLHLCPKPLAPLHATRRLYKWVSTRLMLPASHFHWTEGVSWSMSPGECPLLNDIHIIFTVGEGGRVGIQGSGGLKTGEKQQSFGRELQLDPWSLSSHLGYQNTEPSASYCRPDGECGVNIIHLGSRIQTAIICYSQTESYYLIPESRQMVGGSHILSLSLLSLSAAIPTQSLSGGQGKGQVRMRT